MNELYIKDALMRLKICSFVNLSSVKCLPVQCNKPPGETDDNLEGSKTLRELGSVMLICKLK